jgi:hypothetical protein
MEKFQRVLRIFLLFNSGRRPMPFEVDKAVMGSDVHQNISWWRVTATTSTPAVSPVSTEFVNIIWGKPVTPRRPWYIVPTWA